LTIIPVVGILALTGLRKRLILFDLGFFAVATAVCLIFASSFYNLTYNAEFRSQLLLSYLREKKLSTVMNRRLDAVPVLRIKIGNFFYAKSGTFLSFLETVINLVISCRVAFPVTRS